MDLGLASRVFVVTAASSGLGRASAAALVAEGARVVLVARRAAVLAEVVNELGAEVAVALPGDLADPALGDQACRLALSTYGRLDGALVSVGGPPRASVFGTTAEQWQQAFDGVFLATLRVTAAVVAHTTAADPAIAWVLSTSVKTPIAELAASNGLRPGLAMLVKQLADELGPSGARIVGLLPGRIDTDRVREVDDRQPDPVAARRAAEETIPLRRYGRPEEFGRVAAFALSPAASYLTGCLLAVDGGAMRSL